MLTILHNTSYRYYVIDICFEFVLNDIVQPSELCLTARCRIALIIYIDRLLIARFTCVYTYTHNKDKLLIR